MNHRRAKLSCGVCLFLLQGWGMSSYGAQQPAAVEVRTLQSPAGGVVEFGPVAGELSLRDAMLSLLRQVHARIGSRPEIGKFVQSRDGMSVAVFFSVPAKKGEDKPKAGLVIVATGTDNSRQAAVFLDDADRFASTEAELLSMLSAAEEKAPADPVLRLRNGVSAGKSGMGPFHLMSGGDESASICLPVDWQITEVSNGALLAKGPHGEMMSLGVAEVIFDPDNPSARAMASNSAYRDALHLKYPPGGDLFTTFTEAVNQLRDKKKMPHATFSLVHSQNLDSGEKARQSAEFIFNADLADGVGMRKGIARIDANRLSHQPEWFMFLSSSTIPLPYVEAEESTLHAVIRTFRQKNLAIGMDDQGPHGDPGYWDPVKKKIVMGREETSAQNCGAIDRDDGMFHWSVEITQEFTIDASALKDGDSAGGATLSNKFADLLAKDKPGRFEIVENRDFLKGREY